MSSLKVVDLRPNRNLLNSNFSGYKLSLEATPVLKYALKTAPARVLPTEEQYSSLHARMFTLQNHLVCDPWNSGHSYFTDRDFVVQKVEWDSDTGRMNQIQSVLTFKRSDDRSEDEYNVSFYFIADNKCILSDGNGVIYVIDTGSRITTEQWKVINKTRPLERDGGFIVQDARYNVGNNQLFLLLNHVCQEETAHYSILDWITYKIIDNRDLQRLSHRQLKSKGFINYAAIDQQNHAINLVTDKSYQFTIDTEKPLADVNGKGGTHGGDFPFTWTQTNEEILLVFKPIKESQCGDYMIDCIGSQIKVVFEEGGALMDAELFGEIQTELVCKSFEHGCLRLKLPKADHDSVPWPYLMLDGPPETIEIKADTNASSTISTFESEMEECDFTVNGEEAEYFFERMDADTHQITHRIHLGPTPPLFAVNLDPAQLPALALRYDVDAIICTVPQLTNDDWNLHHLGTLNAFGYVQASKQQKKFMSCSPDLNTAVICEAQRHIFVYKGHYDSASGLRNRNGPKTSVGQQKLIQLDDDAGAGEVLGMLVENEFILLLTENHLLCLQTRIVT